MSGRWKSLSDWLHGPVFPVYLSHFLSSWGDRMWSFAISLYLVFLADKSLLLAAIFGFSQCGSILLFGGLIGNWVDNNRRIKVVRTSLAIQNSAVVLCAVSLCILVAMQAEIKPQWNGGLWILCEAIIILLAVIAGLASTATKISLQKDWIVEVAGEDRAKLADLNASIRRIDLMCKILAPVAVGQIMTFGSMFVGAVTIACWNVFSVFAEYFLLLRTYHLVPRLAHKKMKSSENLDEEIIKQTEMKDMSGPRDTEEGQGTTGSEALVQQDADLNVHHETEEEEEPRTETKEKSCVSMMFERFTIICKGWGVYASQAVVQAGIGLACLYMTVLGFDSITVGYIYAQGLSEAILGLCMGLGGLTGIIGTFLYVALRKKVGLERTGLFSFWSEVLCLVLCLASVWAPGSPFDLSGRSSVSQRNCTTISTLPSNVATLVTIQPLDDNRTDSDRRKREVLHYADNLVKRHENIIHDADSMIPPMVWFHQLTAVHKSVKKRSVPDSAENSTVPDGLVSSDGNHLTENNSTAFSESESTANTEQSVTRLPAYQSLAQPNGSAPPDGQDYVGEFCQPEKSKISIILFVTGIILSRVGLWMADLTVTQLLQENVKETERGVVGGVQSSVNMLMDMVKFVLVIAIPQPERFGLLIILSFISVCCGGCFYACYTWKVRGHLFHFNKLSHCVWENNNLPDQRGQPVTIPVIEELDPEDGQGRLKV